MKYKGFWIGAAVMLVIILSMGATLTDNAIFNKIFNSTSNSVNVSMVQSTVGLDVSEETALTNTVNPEVTITHTTSGTPANNIGVSIDFLQETAAGNTETGARIAAVATDTTAASEDFSIDFYTMAAGATAAKKTSFGSTGIITMAGAATLDNTTSATELNLTETTIQLTGAVNLDGGTVTVNQDSGDYDFIVESNDVATALVVDAGANKISHGTWDVYNFTKTTAQSYSLTSSGRAANFMQTVGAAGTFHLMTELLTTPGAGAVITIKTGDSNDITIDTEGAEDIDGADTYVLDGTMEAVTLTNDGTNWFVIGGYLE